MKPAILALPLFLLGSTATAAAAPEDDYVAARDAAIAKIESEAKNPKADVSKLKQNALADLERRMHAMIGQLSAYTAKGNIVGLLSENDAEADASSGVSLDALHFMDEGRNPEVYVTTEGLLARWLSKPADWWTQTGKTPPSIEKALTNEDFYTNAVNGPAGFSKTLNLPIKKPASVDFAVALLGAWAEERPVMSEQSIIVALQKGGKVYIALDDAKKYKPIPACEAILNKEPNKDMYDAYRACYIRRIPKQAFLPALVKEAEEIADKFGAD